MLLLSTPDDGSAYNFQLSGALFASILEVNSQAPAGSDTGNISAIEEILADGYSNAVQKKFLVTAGLVASAIQIATAVAALAAALASVAKFSQSHWPSSPSPISLSLSQYDIDELDSLPSTIAVYKVAYESTVFVVTVPNTANFEIATATQAQGATTTGLCPVDDQATAVRTRRFESVQACADPC